MSQYILGLSKCTNTLLYVFRGVSTHVVFYSPALVSTFSFLLMCEVHKRLCVVS